MKRHRNGDGAKEEGEDRGNPLYQSALAIDQTLKERDQWITRQSLTGKMIRQLKESQCLPRSICCIKEQGQALQSSIPLHLLPQGEEDVPEDQVID